MTHRSLDIGEVEIRWAPERDREAGLLAYVAATIGGAVRLDGMTLRRARDGSWYLAFAYRRDSKGRERWFARPLTDAAKRDFEEAVRLELVRRQNASTPGPHDDPAGAGHCRIPRGGGGV